MKEKTCERCDGKQFHAMSTFEHLHCWRPQLPLREYWYCPRCDWGRDPAKDEVLF